MLMKSVYLGAAALSLGLMLFEAPSGSVLASSPDRGKVQRQTATTTGSTELSIARRRAIATWIFIGGISGGK